MGLQKASKMELRHAMATMCPEEAGELLSALKVMHKRLTFDETESLIENSPYMKLALTELVLLAAALSKKSPQQFAKFAGISVNAARALFYGLAKLAIDSDEWECQ